MEQCYIEVHQGAPPTVAPVVR